jgi:DNA-binding IclR family transcriptional regulator
MLRWVIDVSYEGPRERAVAGTTAAGGPSTTLISLSIIHALLESGGEDGVSALAAKVGVPKARVHRHLAVLKDAGYITQDEVTKRYRVGWRLYLLGQDLVGQFDVVRIAKPAMEELREAVGQTTVLTTFTDEEVVVLDVLSGRSPVDIVLHPGVRFGYHCVAQGKVGLAFGPRRWLDAALRGMTPNTVHTITDAATLEAELELVRRQGWADAPEEIYTGVNAIAAPVFSAQGEPMGAMAVVGSIHYLPTTPSPHTVSAVLRGAEQLSRRIGYTGPYPPELDR